MTWEIASRHAPAGTADAETLQPLMPPLLCSPMAYELLPAGLRAGTRPKDVFRCLFYSVAALQLAAAAVNHTSLMVKIELLHCDAVHHPDLVLCEFVPMGPHVLWPLL